MRAAGYWLDLCGWYRLSARLTDVRLRGIIGAGAEVFVRGGRLMLRFLTPVPDLYQGLVLYPDDETDPYVFRVNLSDSGLETMQIVFGQDREGATTRLHFDLMALTLDKQPTGLNPRRWGTGALATVGAVGTAVALRRHRRRARRQV